MEKKILKSIKPWSAGNKVDVIRHFHQLKRTYRAYDNASCINAKAIFSQHTFIFCISLYLLYSFHTKSTCKETFVFVTYPSEYFKTVFYIST